MSRNGMTVLGADEGCVFLVDALQCVSMDAVGTDTVATVMSYVTNPEMLWAAFGVVIGVIAAVSFVLHYHWRNYGVNRSLITKAQIIYFTGVAVLLIAALLSLSAYGAL